MASKTLLLLGLFAVLLVVSEMAAASAGPPGTVKSESEEIEVPFWIENIGGHGRGGHYIGGGEGRGGHGKEVVQSTVKSESEETVKPDGYGGGHGGGGHYGGGGHGGGGHYGGGGHGGHGAEAVQSTVKSESEETMKPNGYGGGHGGYNGGGGHYGGGGGGHYGGGGGHYGGGGGGHYGGGGGGHYGGGGHGGRGGHGAEAVQTQPGH